MVKKTQKQDSLHIGVGLRRCLPVCLVLGHTYTHTHTHYPICSAPLYECLRPPFEVNIETFEKITYVSKMARNSVKSCSTQQQAWEHVLSHFKMFLVRTPLLNVVLVPASLYDLLPLLLQVVQHDSVVNAPRPGWVLLHDACTSILFLFTQHWWPDGALRWATHN